LRPLRVCALTLGPCCLFKILLLLSFQAMRVRKGLTMARVVISSRQRGRTDGRKTNCI
jgi:hypothetical protein